MASTPLFPSAAPWGFCGAGAAVVSPSAGSSCHRAARPALGAGSEAQGAQNSLGSRERVGRGLEVAAEELVGGRGLTASCARTWAPELWSRR